MAKSEPNSGHPLQSFFRLCIMGGTLAVGGMALYLYGPPAEKVAPMLDQAISQVQQFTAHLTDQGASQADNGLLQPAEFAAPPATALAYGDALQPLDEVATDWHQDSLLAPATALAPLPPTPSQSGQDQSVAMRSGDSNAAAMLASHPELQPMVAQLQAAGATDLKLATWGSAGNLHRFSCSLPLSEPGANPGAGLRRQFDVIDMSPAAAVEGVLSAMQDWRNAAGLPITQ